MERLFQSFCIHFEQCYQRKGTWKWTEQSQHIEGIQFRCAESQREDRF